jgi:two-component system NarL family sensor kinase
MEVIDDGVGMAEGRRSGVGLSSMRERAEELGGRCDVEPNEEGGTRVLARLPLPASEERPI